MRIYEIKIFFENIIEKIKINKSSICIYICFLIFPLICCKVMCIVSGCSIRSIYFPQSNWNDEIIYYKMVEGIVNGGIKGYFGYNESHAILGHMSTWSPLLVIFWCLFGWIFGWTMLSPIYCNITLIAIAMILFSILVKPNWSQTFAILSMYALSQYITRYTLSLLPEIAVYALLIVFLGLIINLNNTTILEKKYEIKVYLSLAIAVLLSLMRPYYLLLILLSSYELYKYNKKKGVIVGGSVCVISIICYFIIYHYFTAPYFAQLLEMSWINEIVKNPFLGCRDMVANLIIETHNLFVLIGDFADNPLMAISYIIFFTYITLFLVKAKTERMENGNKIFLLFWSGFMLAQFLSIIFCFTIESGVKHIQELLMAGVFISGIYLKAKDYKYILILSIFLFALSADDGYMWEIPEFSEKKYEEISLGKEQWSSNTQMDEIEEWNNTVLWVLSDKKGATPWQYLYAIPEGMGINICKKDYVMDNYLNLKGKYIFINEGGTIDNKFQMDNKQLVADYGSIHVWMIR